MPEHVSLITALPAENTPGSSAELHCRKPCAGVKVDLDLQKSNSIVFRRWLSRSAVMVCVVIALGIITLK